MKKLTDAAWLTFKRRSVSILIMLMARELLLCYINLLLRIGMQDKVVPKLLQFYQIFFNQFSFKCQTV